MGHRVNEQTAIDTTPRNLEAEQALLGAIMVNNDAYATVQDFLEPAHFFEPIHGEIFAACQALIEKGSVAGPVTVRQFVDPEAMKAVGGAKYLARLCTAAVTVLHAGDYGRAIYDAFVRRQLVEIGEDMAFIAARPKIDTTAEKMLEEFECRLSNIRGIAASEKTVWSIGESLEATIKNHDDKQAGQSGIAMVPFGLEGLDDVLGGLERGEMALLAARPRMGKSAGMCDFAYHQATQGYNVGIISIDMNHRTLAARIASKHLAMKGTMVPYEKALKGRLDALDRASFSDALQDIREMPIWLDDGAAPTVTKIVSRAREWQRMLARKGQRLDVLYVDHVHKMQATKDKSYNETAAITAISAGLTAAARELDVALCALCQLNRDLERREDKRPMLADLRQSGALEQDARQIIFMHREWEYRKDPEPAQYDKDRMDWESDRATYEHLVEFKVAKQNNGPTRTVKAYCDLPVNLIASERPSR